MSYNSKYTGQQVEELLEKAGTALQSVPEQVNADWNATSGKAQILNKPTIPTVPTKVSEFENDAQYITETAIEGLNASFVETDGTADEPETPEWQAYVDAKIGDIDTILDNINGEEV